MAGEVGKRTFDVVFASMAVLVSAPLYIAIAIAVWLESGRPVLFRARRIGRHSVPFTMYKFRTMVVGAEHAGGLSTAKNDLRLTRVGRWLRRYKLDEIPQFLNVLRGDMSVVGPRPEIPEYVDKYWAVEQEILAVRPGLTDYASIEFFELAEALGEQDADRWYVEKVRPTKTALRLRYVREHSFGEDLRIIGRTIGRILKSWVW